MVKKYDREIRDSVASRVIRRSTGRPKEFNADIEAKIIDAWADDDTRTYREVAEDLGTPRSTSYKRLRPMGDASQEGKRGGGAKRVHVDPSYAPLRARLGI